MGGRSQGEGGRKGEPTHPRTFWEGTEGGGEAYEEGGTGEVEEEGEGEVPAGGVAADGDVGFGEVERVDEVTVRGGEFGEFGGEDVFWCEFWRG